MHKQDNLQVAEDLEGFLAKPIGKGPFPGVLVIMEAYGLTAHIQGVCRRLAEAGFVAPAPDHFHGELIAYADSAVAMAKIPTLKDEQLLKEMGQALDWLDAQPDVRQAAHGIIGFCMGGRLAFLANCRFPQRLQAAVGFYAGSVAPEISPDRFGRTPPISEAEKMRTPLYLGYGAEDAGITPAEHARVAAALSAAKKRYTLAVYPGAGHGFLCEERSAYAPAVAPAAWRDAMGFLKVHLG